MLQLAIQCYVETDEPIKLAFDMNSLFDLFDTVLRPMPPEIRVLSRRMSHILDLEKISPSGVTSKLLNRLSTPRDVFTGHDCILRRSVD